MGNKIGKASVFQANWVGNLFLSMCLVTCVWYCAVPLSVIMWRPKKYVTHWHEVGNAGGGWNRKKEEPSTCTTHGHSQSTISWHTSQPTLTAKNIFFVWWEEMKWELSDSKCCFREEMDVEEVVRKMCPTCTSPAVTVKSIHRQIDIFMLVQCDCGAVIHNTMRNSKVQNKNYYPLWIMFVYGLMLLGVGFYRVSKLTSLSMKSISIAMYLRYSKYVTETAVEHAKHCLMKCFIRQSCEWGQTESWRDGHIGSF